MDPASIAILVSAIGSALGAAAEPIVHRIKQKKWAKIDEVRNMLQRALAVAQTKGENKLDQLTNKLLSLDLIQRTPALASVVDKLKRETKQKISDLRNDITEMGLTTLEAEQQIARAEDSNVFRMDKETEKAQEEVNKSVQKLSQIEQRL